MSATSEEPVSEEQIVSEVAEKPAKKYARRYGTRFEVFDSETAEMTRGGLKKEDLMMSKSGKIVSKKKEPEREGPLRAVWLQQTRREKEARQKKEELKEKEKEN